MATKADVGVRSKMEALTTAVVDADEKGMSMLIGGLLVFGLALGGLVIGYASSTMQTGATAVLVSVGSILTGAGIWNLLRDSLDN